MPPEQQPPQGQRPPQRSAPRPQQRRAPRPAAQANAGERATEALFLILVAVAIFSVAIGLLHSPLARGVYIQLFRPASLSYYDSANGARVYTASEGNVRESPGGLRIGSQPRGASGTVIGGPSSAVGTRFWDIDFDSGPDGWVAESELLLAVRSSSLSRFVSTTADIFYAISTILSLLFLTGIIYSIIRSVQVGAAQSAWEHERDFPAHAPAPAPNYANHRWERVLIHVQSESPADWRLAILEADIMLAELLDRMGYAGENVGEKLKTVEQSDFTTIEDAWEAHKVRNLIAHQGADYVLSRREAQRVVSLYANVFREFRYI